MWERRDRASEREGRGAAHVVEGDGGDLSLGGVGAGECGAGEAESRRAEHPGRGAVRAGGRRGRGRRGEGAARARPELRTWRRQQLALAFPRLLIPLVVLVKCSAGFLLAMVASSARTSSSRRPCQPPTHPEALPPRTTPRCFPSPLLPVQYSAHVQARADGTWLTKVVPRAVAFSLSSCLASSCLGRAATACISRTH